METPKDFEDVSTSQTETCNNETNEPATALSAFFNEELNATIRAKEIDGETWFVGKDVAVALGYANSRDTLARHVDEEDKAVTFCDSLGGTQKTTLITKGLIASPGNCVLLVKKYGLVNFEYGNEVEVRVSAIYPENLLKAIRKDFV